MVELSRFSFERPVQTRQAGDGEWAQRWGEEQVWRQALAVQEQQEQQVRREQ